MQQFHLVIRYKKGIESKFVDMLSRPSINASIVLQHNSLAHENYIEQCNTPVLTLFALNVYDVYIVMDHGVEL